MIFMISEFVHSNKHGNKLNLMFNINCLLLIFYSDYEDSEYSDVENIIDDVNVEEKVGKLLRSMQPQMPLGNIVYPMHSNPD